MLCPWPGKNGRQIPRCGALGADLSSRSVAHLLTPECPMMTCLSSAFNVEDVDIEEVIAEVTVVVGERPSLVTTRPGQPWVGLTTECAIHIAHDDRTRGRIREEAQRLGWAGRNGIPVPSVVEQRDGWLATTRAVDDGVTSGPAYVEAAIGAARARARAAPMAPST